MPASGTPSSWSLLLIVTTTGTHRALDGFRQFLPVMTFRDQGRFTEAPVYAEQADVLSSTPEGQRFSGLTKYSIGRLHHLLGDQDRAVEYLKDAIERSLAFGSNELAVYSGSFLAKAYLQRGEEK